ncbi:MAG: hypothetical protein D3904_03915 [Candidatus Electrothrix sp. EH2]|nr:hypothetical protein [Candidatus Electrothrix sp. EH2]
MLPERKNMKLTDTTEATIKQFAGSTIFGRGYGYYEDGMVLSLEYDADSDALDSQVSGSTMDYEVQIRGTKQGIDADCDCPYEGRPCKHVVAVLLTFLHQKKTYMDAHRKRKKTESSLASKIRRLSHNALAELLITYSRRYPDVKRELMLRLETDKKATLETIEQQINKVFSSTGSNTYSPSQIAGKVSRIIQSVQDASPEMQARIYWAAADAAIGELDEYGIYDNPLEDLAIDTAEALLELLTEHASLQEMKSGVIDKLLEYYLSGNNGLTDFLYDSASELCSEQAHYQIMIDRLKNSRSSYDQNLLAGWYAKIGDTDAQRRTLESKLEYGMDYWRLAQYWFEQGDPEKGINVVLDGIAQGKGRKRELYTALQEYYQKENDYDSIFKMLQQKLEKDELDERKLKDDGTYQCLWSHYSGTENYGQQKELLNLCLSGNKVDLDLYKQAEKTLNKDDRSDFSAQLIENLQDEIKREQKTRNWNYGLFYRENALSILAEIYQYTADVDALFETVKGNFQLMERYESLLLPEYPAEYLETYKRHIDRLIEARGRKKYQEAVPYVKKVQEIYTKVLKNAAGWQDYITRLRSANKKLRALQEELTAI